jgi:hypothetical protein
VKKTSVPALGVIGPSYLGLCAYTITVNKSTAGLADIGVCVTAVCGALATIRKSTDK